MPPPAYPRPGLPRVERLPSTSPSHSSAEQHRHFRDLACIRVDRLSFWSNRLVRRRYSDLRFRAARVVLRAVLLMIGCYVDTSNHALESTATRREIQPFDD